MHLGLLSGLWPGLQCSINTRACWARCLEFLRFGTARRPWRFNSRGNSWRVARSTIPGHVQIKHEKIVEFNIIRHYLRIFQITYWVWGQCESRNVSIKHVESATLSKLSRYFSMGGGRRFSGAILDACLSYCKIALRLDDFCSLKYRRIFLTSGSSREYST